MTGTRADEVYERVVKPLSPVEQLRLATLILNGIPPQAIVDFSESWSEEDMREFSASSWNYTSRQVEGEETDAGAG